MLGSPYRPAKPDTGCGAHHPSPQHMCRYVACMRAPGVGSQDIPSRLKRQFAIFGLPSPSVESVSSMFGAVLEGRFHTAAFGRAVADAASSLVAATLAVLEEAQANLQPALPRLHYQFSLHDVAKVGRAWAQHRPAPGMLGPLYICAGPNLVHLHMRLACSRRLCTTCMRCIYSPLSPWSL